MSEKQLEKDQIALAREVAAAIVFLCSKEAGYITGQVIGINGGIV